LVLAILVVAVGLIALLVLNRQSDSRSSTEETPTATPAPSSSEVQHEEGDLPEVIADNLYDCKLQLPADEYEPFIQRLLEFEAIRLSSSQDRLELMTPYATEDFLKTQADVGNDTVITVSISLENPSPYGCYTDDSTEIAAYINPVVTITDLTTGQVQQQHQTLSTHHTQWIKVGGEWYVNQERF
jgi:hypothetical protein